jgi:hypothetical protein
MPQHARQGGARGGAALAADRLRWLVALLALTASALGLLGGEVYGDDAATAEMFRAYDLVTALVVVPGLAQCGPMSHAVAG